MSGDVKRDEEEFFISTQQSTGETYTLFDSLKDQSSTTTSQHQPDSNEEGCNDNNDSNADASSRVHDDAISRKIVVGSAGTSTQPSFTIQQIVIKKANDKELDEETRKTAEYKTTSRKGQFH